MLSNTSGALMNTAYHFTPNPRPRSKHSTTFHITMIERPTHRQQLFLHQNTTNSRPIAMETRMVNSVAQRSQRRKSTRIFKFRSLSGFLICRSGGPISWKSTRKNQKALSSRESEIMATNKCARELQSLKHCAKNIGILEAYSRTKIYNNNKAAFQWAASVT